jgi:four helix bundle protein
MSRFENLVVWQRARELRIARRDLAKNVRCLELRDQMTRAAMSLMANIAEGSERGSRADFRRFLLMARGSCGELRNHLIVAHDDGFISRETFRHLHDASCRLGKMLSALIATLSGSG